MRLSIWLVLLALVALVALANFGAIRAFVSGPGVADDPEVVAPEGD